MTPYRKSSSGAKSPMTPNKPSGVNLGAERPTETPANPPGIAPDASLRKESKCLRCSRKCEDYICEKCSLVETET